MAHSKWVPIAQDDGLYILVAKRDKRKPNQPAVMYNTSTGQESDEMPLQTFFKWGNFEAVKAGTTFEDIQEDNAGDSD